MKKRIGIIGLGLIGGSIALSLRGKFDIVGYDTDSFTCDYANSNNIARIVPIEEMTSCEAVFVCVPVSATSSALESVTKLLPDVIVSDVASVKAPFEFIGGRYVGTHPMAGTEKGGIRAAKAHLFENAYWVITGSGKDADTVESIIKLTGAKPVRMTASEHDRAVSYFSHAPHAVAYALVSASVESGGSPIAGSGFFDTTRIAGSSGEFWSEVFKLNKDNVLSALGIIDGELSKIKSMLSSDDYDGLKAYMNAAKLKREALFCGGACGEALYVDLVDRIGEFERVTGKLAGAGINVASIALMPGREGAGGALRLEFENSTDRLRAAKALGITTDKESV
ncbi:MAG: prephenate dehydrogenase/arogenate dehydrogenase family protein [Clostridiales bacterium]|nr:prephenate dehydrogenase/arogenate dehydrogenase family protein [Clostridiales bacterium]